MEINKKKINRIVFRQTIFIGWVGGIAFSIFLFTMCYFKLIDTKVCSSINNNFAIFNNWYGKLFLLIVLSFVSIVITIIYYMIAKKMSQWYIGLFYGLLLWLIVCSLYYILYKQNLLFTTDTVHESINLLCLFILYGLFIGYSTSFAYELQLLQLNVEHKQYKSSSDYDKI